MPVAHYEHPVRTADSQPCHAHAEDNLLLRGFRLDGRTSCAAMKNGGDGIDC
jgi:hypothetical protein